MAVKLKSFIKVIIGRELFVQTNYKCQYTRVGSQYGGWDIVLDELDQASLIYSVGVGQDVSFDLALINALGATVHAFDPTPKSIHWVQTQSLPPQFILHDYGLAGFDGEVSFNPPENPDHVSHTILERPSTQAKALVVPVKKLGTIMKDLGHNQIDLLKMDIEGAEYGVIEDMVRGNIRPKQLLIEFHHRFPNIHIKQTKNAINSIQKMGYKLFSISNSKQEFSFIHL